MIALPKISEGAPVAGFRVYSQLPRSAGAPRARVLSFVLTLALAGCATGNPDNSAGTPAGVSRVAPNAEFSVRDSTSIESSARSDFEKALDCLRDKNYEKGIELLNKVVERSPKATAPYINLAIAYEITDKPKQAEESLKKALAINPDHPVTNNEMGILYRKTGRFQEARKSYEHVLERYPGYLPARKNLGVVCDLYIRDLECALKNYQLYNAANPEDKVVKIWIADVEKRLGR
jgi:tetratricopeptide (TPR) repeat protein